MISLTVPFVIILVCVLGYAACLLYLGKERGEWDIPWLFFQLVNFTFWIIALLFSLLMWEVFK